MTDQSVNLYRRMLRLEDGRGAHEALLYASHQYGNADPTTRRGMLLKAKGAVASFDCAERTGDDSAARMIRHFFRTRKTVDAEWLRDLRHHVETVSLMAPGNDYAIRCLQSIVRGMSRPRLA